MTAERDSMTLNEISCSALGVEERSDKAPRGGHARPTPDPEVVAKPKRRQFTAQYRLRILDEAERCTQPGEVEAPVHEFPGAVKHDQFCGFERPIAAITELNPIRDFASPTAHPLFNTLNLFDATSLCYAVNSFEQQLPHPSRFD